MGFGVQRDLCICESDVELYDEMGMFNIDLNVLINEFWEVGEGLFA